MSAPVWAYLLLTLALTVIISETWALLRDRQRLRAIRRMSPGPPATSRLLPLASRLLSWYQRDTLPYRLARAGHPRFIGETPAHFYAAKLLFGLGLGLRFGSHAVTAFALYAAVGFMVPDVLLILATRRRHEQILQQLPTMLDFIRRTLAGPGTLPDALAALPDRLTGPLSDETRRLSAQYTLTGDLARCLGDFAARIGMDEIDQLCLALHQAELTGRVKTILGSQADAIKLRLQADQKRAAATQANMLPAVSILVVANILLLIGLPLIYQLTADLQTLR
ncbi:type II secretion system F family protein [Symbiobacterium terraclitae]|uniref:type II secretion system F family protein n=1 Tax=Symbiobacterium terraclitae TaxID=557451 RepID=UPI0035B553AA